MCNRHIEQGRVTIERQRAMIVELQQNGHQTRLADALLAWLLNTQQLHEDHRDRLQIELDREARSR